MRWLLALVLTTAMARGGLNFPEILKEVQAPADAKSVTTDFEFSNDGDKPVKIRHYDAACSCMSVQVQGGKLDYAPGDKGLIRTAFELGNFAGEIDKMVMIWLEGDRDDQPSIRLTVRVHIPELVKLEPKTLRWSVGTKPASQSFKIHIFNDKPIKILNVTNTNENFRQELLTLTPGKEYELKVTPVELATPCIGILRVETDCQIFRHKIQQGFVVVSTMPAAPAAPATPATPATPSK